MVENEREDRPGGSGPAEPNDPAMQRGRISLGDMTNSMSERFGESSIEATAAVEVAAATPSLSSRPPPTNNSTERDRHQRLLTELTARITLDEDMILSWEMIRR